MNQKPTALVTTPSDPQTSEAVTLAAQPPKPAPKKAQTSGRYWFVFDRWLPMASSAEDEFVLA